MDDKKKIGRPKSLKPKSIKLTVRVDEETNKILEDYCNRKNKTIVEGVRDGINYSFYFSSNFLIPLLTASI